MAIDKHNFCHIVDMGEKGKVLFFVEVDSDPPGDEDGYIVHCVAHGEDCSADMTMRAYGKDADHLEANWPENFPFSHYAAEILQFVDQADKLATDLKMGA